MQIEITPELLADLKDKAEKIKFETWHVLHPDNSGGGYCVVGNTLKETIARIKGNGNVIKGEYIGPRKMTPRNAEYIAAANPAVMLALIAKIEQLENENTALSNSILSYQDKLSHYEKTNP